MHFLCRARAAYLIFARQMMKDEGFSRRVGTKDLTELNISIARRLSLGD
jgi:hypothetical protein